MSRVIMVALPCCPLGYLPSMNFIAESLCTRELLLPLSSLMIFGIFVCIFVCQVKRQCIYTGLADCNCLSFTLRSGNLPSLLMVIFSFAIP